MYYQGTQLRNVKQNKVFLRKHVCCIVCWKIAPQVQQDRQQTKLPDKYGFSITVMHGYPQTLLADKASDASVRIAAFIMPALNDIPGGSGHVITHRRRLPRPGQHVRKLHVLTPDR
ncbi:hypothetical protein L9F34_001962 [Klebsiella aerogenes]|nr:hypothetical protein [Klebsiella aerogenes]